MLAQPFFGIDVAQAEVQPDEFLVLCLARRLQPGRGGCRIELADGLIGRKQISPDESEP